MLTKDEIDNKRAIIRGKSGIVCDYIYLYFPIFLFICLLIILIYNLLIISPKFTTRQAGYLLASSLFILGLIGLCVDNTNLFQQQAFKLLVYSGVIVFILTLCYSITIDIIMIIKDKENISTSIIYGFQ